MGMQQGDVFACGLPADKKCPVLLEVLASCECADGCVKCCGEPMARLHVKTADQGREKHVPVIEKIQGGYKVKVGDVAHPMEKDHWIQFVELRAGNAVYRKYLQPGQAPEATFLVADLQGAVTAYEHCNKHGLWSGK